MTDTPTDPAELLLDQAKALVTGARRNAYGNPEDNFRTIAELWTTYLQRAHCPIAREWKALKLTPSDVAAMMVLMKCARLGETPDHADSWRAIAGYAACGARASGADLGSAPARAVTPAERAALDAALVAPPVVPVTPPATLADSHLPKSYRKFSAAETAFINAARLNSAPHAILEVPPGTTRERLAELQAEIAKAP